jgi:hypothetical protein
LVHRLQFLYICQIHLQGYLFETVTNRIIYITALVTQLAMFSTVGYTGLTGWVQAEVNRLEQNTFEIDDEITDANLESDNQWSKEFEQQLFKEEITITGITIPEYE